VAIKGQILIGICYFAWDGAHNIGQTGDAANHVLKLVRDGVESSVTNFVNEVDSVGCPGLYSVNLTAAEMNADFIVLQGKSSTAGVSIVPVGIATNAN
jgi:hypothetical protein